MCLFCLYPTTELKPLYEVTEQNLTSGSRSPSPPSNFFRMQSEAIQRRKLFIFFDSVPHCHETIVSRK